MARSGGNNDRDARRLTDEAKEHARELWRKMVNLYEGGAHTALNYDSWESYCEYEFGISGRRAYNLLDAGRVEKIVQSAARPRDRELPNAMVTRPLAQLLPPFNAQSARVRNGSDERVAEAWSKVVEQHEDEKPITEPEVMYSQP